MGALFAANALLWWQSASVTRGWASNSDFYIARLCAGFAFLTAPFFTALLMGDPVARDFRCGIDALLLSTPVRRAEYLLGKFCGAFLILIACYAVYPLTLLPLQHTSVEGMIVLPWRAWPYLKHFAVFVIIPHLMIAGVLFTVGTLTRSLKLVYGLLVTGYAFYIGTMATLAAYGVRRIWLFDPLLFDWVNKLARGRSASEVNRLVIIYGAEVIANRAALVGIAALRLMILCLRFGRETMSADRATDLSLLKLEEQREFIYTENFAATSEAHESATRQLTGIPRVTMASGGWRLRWMQFAAMTSAEVRLLGAERSLIILAPLVVILASVEFSGFSNVFGAPYYPLSSIYAPNSVRALLILLGGLTIFYAGELMSRDRELKIEPELWSAPVPDRALLLARFAALLLLMCGLALLVALAAIALQLARGPVFDLKPYLIVYGVILLPSLMVMIGAALTLNVLPRDKYLAAAAGFAVAGGLFYLFSQGHTGWLWNPVLYQLWIYSDLTGLEPYRIGLLWHRVYWLALTVAMLAIALRFFRRGSATRKTGTLIAAAAAIVIAVSAGLIIQREINRGPDRESLVAARLRYEERFAAWRDVLQPEWQRVDLQVELFPAEHRLLARGAFKLQNRGAEPISAILISLDPTYQWRTLRLEGAAAAPQVEEMARVFTLAAALKPGEATTLHAEWDATIPQGLRAGSAIHANFIMAGGTLLGGPDFTEWLPRTGYLRKWEIADEGTRQRYGKAPAPSEQTSASGFPVAPFDSRIEITLPANQTAIASGRLIETRELGARKTFVYQSEHPTGGLTIVCAPYVERRRGDEAVYHHPAHGFNADTLLTALAAARQQYERDYGALPWRDLRMVEFPRLANFAISYATTIPCAESLVFLAREDAAHVNVNYFAAAHEAAHQWFGSMVVAGNGPGSAALLEGLAEYSAGALIEEQPGKEAATIFRRFEETTYLRDRQPDHELPLAQVSGHHPAHQVVVYQKAGLVFHMLETLIGRQRMNAALKEYVARFAWSRVHPTIHDLIAIFKKQTPDDSLAWFYEEWFERVIVPDFRIVSATVQKVGSEYLIEFTADNAGQGTMPVTVEAIAGNRRAGSGTAAIQVTLEAGRETRAAVRCRFKPERLILDPRHDVPDADRLSNNFPL